MQAANARRVLAPRLTHGSLDVNSFEASLKLTEKQTEDFSSKQDSIAFAMATLRESSEKVPEKHDDWKKAIQPITETIGALRVTLRELSAKIADAEAGKELGLYLHRLHYLQIAFPLLDAANIELTQLLDNQTFNEAVQLLKKSMKAYISPPEKRPENLELEIKTAIARQQKEMQGYAAPVQKRIKLLHDELEGLIAALGGKLQPRAPLTVARSPSEIAYEESIKVLPNPGLLASPKSGWVPHVELAEGAWLPRFSFSPNDPASKSLSDVAKGLQKLRVDLQRRFTDLSGLNEACLHGTKSLPEEADMYRRVFKRLKETLLATRVDILRSKLTNDSLINLKYAMGLMLTLRVVYKRLYIFTEMTKEPMAKLRRAQSRIEEYSLQAANPTDLDEELYELFRAGRKFSRLTAPAPLTEYFNKWCSVLDLTLAQAAGRTLDKARVQTKDLLVEITSKLPDVLEPEFLNRMRLYIQQQMIDWLLNGQDAYNLELELVLYIFSPRFGTHLEEWKKEARFSRISKEYANETRGTRPAQEMLQKLALCYSIGYRSADHPITILEYAEADFFLRLPGSDKRAKELLAKVRDRKSYFAVDDDEDFEQASGLLAARFYDNHKNELTRHLYTHLVRALFAEGKLQATAQSRLADFFAPLSDWSAFEGFSPLTPLVIELARRKAISGQKLSTVEQTLLADLNNGL